MSNAIDRLEELEGRATGGVWRQSTRNRASLVADRPPGEYQPVIATHYFLDNDLILSAALHNAAKPLLAVVRAGERLRLIQKQRDKDEAEHAASGRTFGLADLAIAEQDYDTALATLKEMPL